MNLTALGFPHRRETVVILGAGASRGASFVQPHMPAKPPLDADLFNLLRAITFDGKDRADVERLLTFVGQEFGSNAISMETFYSQSYLHDQFVGDIPSGKKSRARRYGVNLEYFRRILPAVFNATIGDRTCAYLGSLIDTLESRDVVISFNYDCLIDRAMKQSGLRRWNPKTGYGFTITEGTGDWEDHTGKGAYPKVGLRLLKPHGSMNWERISDDSIRLLASPYQRREQIEIIPPLWQKAFDKEPYRQIWTAARKSLSSTKAMIVAGYSLPETDVYTQAMMRIDAQQLEFLCIVNPDPGAHDRIKDALRTAVTHKTFMIGLQSMNDLHLALSGSHK